MKGQKPIGQCDIVLQQRSLTGRRSLDAPISPAGASFFQQGDEQLYFEPSLVIGIPERAVDPRAEHPQTMVKDFRGHLQADATARYDELYRSGHVIEVACWAHAHRKIFDLHQTHESASMTELLERIEGLFTVEEKMQG
jgi:hypothetical protein